MSALVTSSFGGEGSPMARQILCERLQVREDVNIIIAQLQQQAKEYVWFDGTPTQLAELIKLEREREIQNWEQAREIGKRLKASWRSTSYLDGDRHLLRICAQERPKKDYYVKQLLV